MLVDGRGNHVPCNAKAIRKALQGDTSMVLLKCYESVNIAYDEPNEEYIVYDGHASDIYDCYNIDVAINIFMELAMYEYNKINRKED